MYGHIIQLDSKANPSLETGNKARTSNACVYMVGLDDPETVQPPRKSKHSWPHNLRLP